MRKILAGLPVIAVALCGNAQIISITDHDLAVKMHAVAPLAVDTITNTVESSHQQALAVGTFQMFNPFSSDITDLSGLEGFPNLYDLTIDGAGMTVLDDVPTTVIILSISQCFSLQQITNWPPALQQLTMGSLNAVWWDPLPNTITHLSLAFWSMPPPLGSTWPADLTMLQLLDVPVFSGVIQNLPETLLELSLGNNGVQDILDGNMMPHLPNSLQVLSFRDQPAAQLPPLPATLTSLVVSGCPIPSLPTLPASLLSVQVMDIPITTLPALPGSLQHLQTENCAVYPLPALPNSLQYLHVINGGLTDLPALPPGLLGLWVADNQLTALPALPTLLSLLNVTGNPGLTTLPALPLVLGTLYADNCAFQSLPALPAGMQTLHVSFNPLDSLPVLPTDLRSLYAIGTNITTLPALPLEMRTCDVQNCASLMCAPWLPPTMITLRVFGTGITCIPNVPDDLNPNALGIPLVICNILNPCPTLNPAIMGTSYIDLDNDGVRDAGEPPLPNGAVQLSPINFIGGTDANGRYIFGVDTGTYSVSGVAALYQTVSSVPATATFTAWQQVDSLNDVGFYLTPNIQDLVMDITDLSNERPGFDSEYQLSYTNVGTQVQDGDISFTHDAIMAFVSSTPVPDAINGTTLTWNFTGLQINEQRSISVTLNTPIGTTLGTPIEHTALVDPLATDQTPTDNAFAYTSTVVGSYDPNDKTVEPAQLTPAQVASGERVSYTIRFQNTGTFLAERVVITDTLSGDLQWNTMQRVASSHDHSWYISGGVLHVIFDGIMLPDSTSDEPDSHGFVKFSMVPVSTLMLGATVQNIANIYFDYNEPVITNAAVFAIDNNVEVGEAAERGMSLSPNPVSDVLTITLDRSQSNVSVEVVDVTGRVVLRGFMNGTMVQLDVAGLKAGCYQVNVNEGRNTARFMKR